MQVAQSQPVAGAVVVTGPALSWRAIIAGFVTALAVQAVLTILGAGIGFSTIRVDDPSNPSLAAISIGAALWWIVANWIALGMGGFAAGRTAGTIVPREGSMHGFMTWALGIAVAAVVLASSLGAGIGALGQAAGKAAGGLAGGTAAVVAQQSASAAPAMDWTAISRDLLRQRDPAAASDEAATAEVAAGAAKIAAGDESVDKGRLAAVIAAKTGVTDDEARARIESFEQSAREARETAKEVADKAIVATRHIALWGFIAIILSGIAAVLGGHAGARATEEQLRRRP